MKMSSEPFQCNTHTHTHTGFWQRWETAQGSYQGLIAAPSVGWPQMVWCVRVCGRNELKVCTMVSFSHISVYSVICQCMHTNTRIRKPFEDCELTGLKVDIAAVLKFKLHRLGLNSCQDDFRQFCPNKSSYSCQGLGSVRTLQVLQLSPKTLEIVWPWV